MVWSILYQVVSLLWHSLRISRLSPDDKTLELLLLPQELLILRRHQKRGPVISRSEQFILLTLLDRLNHAVDLQKAQLAQLILIFKPQTLICWRQELVRHKWTFSNAPKTRGRPSTDAEVVQLILRLARENQWGDDRIVGELKKPGYRISHEAIRQILRSYGIPLLPTRNTGSSWQQFLSHYKVTFLACDFFTVETIRLQTLYVFFFIEQGIRRVHVMGITSHPTQTWVTQQARHMAWKCQESGLTFMHLIHDNDGKYGTSFDAVFASERIEIVLTPFQAPWANACAEQWVRSVREECPGRVIILNQGHLAHILHKV